MIQIGSNLLQTKAIFSYMKMVEERLLCWNNLDLQYSPVDGVATALFFLQYSFIAKYSIGVFYSLIVMYHAPKKPIWLKHILSAPQLQRFPSFSFNITNLHFQGKLKKWWPTIGFAMAIVPVITLLLYKCCKVSLKKILVPLDRLIDRVLPELKTDSEPYASSSSTLLTMTYKWGDISCSLVKTNKLLTLYHLVWPGGEMEEPSIRSNKTSAKSIGLMDGWLRVNIPVI